MFGYCGNNPVSRNDENGCFWHLIIGAVCGSVVGAITSIASQLSSGNEINWAKVGVSALAGSASGFLLASGVGAVGSAVGGAIISMTQNAAEQIIDISNDSEKNSFNFVSMFLDGMVGVCCCLISGPGASGVANNGCGFKCMAKYGASVIKRTAREFTNNGIKSAVKELTPAMTHYLKNTIAVTNNLLDKRVFLSIGFGSLFSICKFF